MKTEHLIIAKNLAIWCIGNVVMAIGITLIEKESFPKESVLPTLAFLWSTYNYFKTSVEIRTNGR